MVLHPQGSSRCRADTRKSHEHDNLNVYRLCLKVGGVFSPLRSPSFVRIVEQGGEYECSLRLLYPCDFISIRSADGADRCDWSLGNRDDLQGWKIRQLLNVENGGGSRGKFVRAEGGLLLLLDSPSGSSSVAVPIRFAWRPPVDPWKPKRWRKRRASQSPSRRVRLMPSGRRMPWRCRRGRGTSRAVGQERAST